MPSRICSSIACLYSDKISAPRFTDGTKWGADWAVLRLRDMPVGRGLATARAPTPTALSRAAFLNLQLDWIRVRGLRSFCAGRGPTTGSVTRTACPLSAQRVRVPFPRHALCRGPSGHARLNPATNAPSSPPPRDAAARHRAASAQRGCPAQCGATSLCVQAGKR